MGFELPRKKLLLYEHSPQPAFLFRSSPHYEFVFITVTYGHVERMDPKRLPKMMTHWKPQRRKKRGRPRMTWKDGIYTAMNERDLRMGEWNNRRQWNMKVGRRRQTS